MKKGIDAVVENTVAGTKQSSRWMRVVQNGLLLAATVGICFGLIEVGLRMLHITSELRYKPNPFFGWTHVSDSTFTRRVADTVVTIHINHHGMRENVEHTYEKPPGVFRILVLGDSFAEAAQVQHDEAFPKLIETTLNSKQFPGVNRVEVINAGTSGYGTDNELLFFLAEGHKYSPDLVLLAFCICNDVRNNWYELDNVEAGGFRKPYFMLGTEGLSLHRYPFELEPDQLRPIKTFLNQNVRLYAFLREARDQLMSASSGTASGIPLDYRVYLKDYPESWETAWRVTGGLLRELKKEVTAHGAGLLVTIVPTRFQVYSKDWRQVLETYSDMKRHEWEIEKPNRLLHQILEQEGIGYVDLLQPFQQYAMQSGTPLYLASDGHWNREGHRLASEILAEELIHQSALSDQSPLEIHKTHSEVR